MISDKAGGCVTGYSDTSGNTYIDRSLNIFKVNADGNILWTKRLDTDTQGKSNQIVDYATSRVVGDGMGGLLVLGRVVRANISGKDDTSLVIQRIDPTGNETLMNGQVVTDNAWNVNQSSRYQAISDDSGNAVVVWVSIARDENKKETGYILQAQKLDHNGKEQWNEGGVILSNTGFELTNESPSLTLEDSSGFTISFGGIGDGIHGLENRTGWAKCLWRASYRIVGQTLYQLTNFILFSK